MNNLWLPSNAERKLNPLKKILQKIDPKSYSKDLDNQKQKKYDKSLRISQPPDERDKYDQKWENFIKIA